jgi:hypothetical protein
MLLSARLGKSLAILSRHRVSFLALYCSSVAFLSYTIFCQPYAGRVGSKKLKPARYGGRSNNRGKNENSHRGG